MRRCQAIPYEGKEPYIFISYSHRDNEKVFPVIEQMVRDGYRVWYDEGIDPGAEWPESIATHLDGCHICIAFLSPQYMASHNCRRELNFALRQKKRFLTVGIEETELSLGMQMQLSATQSIFKYALASDEEFFRKLYATKALPECRREPAEIGGADGGEAGRKADAEAGEKPEKVGEAEAPQSQAEEPAAEAPQSRAEEPGKEEPEAREEEPKKKEPETAAGARETPELSPKPATVLPGTLGIPGIGADDAGAEKKKTKDGEKEKRGPLIALCAAAAMVFLILVALFVVPHGSSENDEQTKAAGSDTAQEADSSADSDGDSSETSTTSATALTLSDDLFDYMLEIEGVVYQFPCETSDFTDNGWTVYDSDDENKTVAGKDKDLIALEYGSTGRRLLVLLYNASGNSVEWRECEVCGISCYFNYEDRQPEILLPGDLDLISVTTEDLEEAYGEPTSSYESTYYVKYSYEEDPSSYDYDHYVDFFIENGTSSDPNGIYMINCSRSDEATVTNEEVPDYLADYAAPTELGDDDLSGILKIDGDLYQIPCPVREFLNNGWELSADDAGKAVYSCRESEAELVRGTETITVYIYNGALYQTIAENCYVESIYLYQGDVESVQLPSGITLGMGEEDVENITAASSNSYELTEYTSTKEYSLTGSAPYYSLVIDIDLAFLAVKGIWVYQSEWDYS